MFARKYEFLFCFFVGLLRSPTLLNRHYPAPPSLRRPKISLRSIFAPPSLSRGGATIALPLRGLADGLCCGFFPHIHPPYLHIPHLHASGGQKFSLRSIFASPSLSRGGATIASPLRGLADGLCCGFSPPYPTPPSFRRPKIFPTVKFFSSSSLSRGGATIASPLRGLASFHTPHLHRSGGQKFFLRSIFCFAIAQSWRGYDCVTAPRFS